MMFLNWEWPAMGRLLDSSEVFLVERAAL
jgi:hypothetical protein